MQEPILFISLILEKLGLPVPHTVIGHTLLEKVCTPYMTYTWLVMAFLIIVPKLTMGRLELMPGKGQNFWEIVIGGLDSIFTESLGKEKARMLYPMMATFALYIVIANLIGLIPGFMSPTSNWNITLAMTLIVWVTHHALGFRYHGLRYLKHFLGPVAIISPFMFVLEMISNFARILSLSIRLFGNILAKEILLAVLFMLAGPFFAPLPIMILGTLVCVIQAAVFVLLAVAYCAESLEAGHEA